MPTEAHERWAEELQTTKCLTIALRCAIAGLSRGAYYYQPKLQDDSMIISILNTITDKHLRWGFPKCFNCIRKLSYKWNHKRVYRVYCELKLNIKIKRKKRIPLRSPEKCLIIGAEAHSITIMVMSALDTKLTVRNSRTQNNKYLRLYSSHYNGLNFFY